MALFGLMNAGALLGYLLDAREARRTLARLQQPDTGHRVAADGTWLWRFTLSPLADELDVPTGSAVVLTSVLGLPFARLRLALPDELLTCDVAAALGRKHAFSLRGMEAAADKHAELAQHMGLLPRAKSTRRAVRPSETIPAGADDAEVGPSPRFRGSVQGSTGRVARRIGGQVLRLR